MQKNIMSIIKKLLGLENEYVCHICGKVFTNPRAYKLHNANHKIIFTKN
ncbi:MAG: hypothetical protein K0B07_04385, partial [DPANN group archaeon]|nr:hypothetical protein [DPANN group archaeon]